MAALESPADFVQNTNWACDASVQNAKLQEGKRKGDWIPRVSAADVASSAPTESKTDKDFTRSDRCHVEQAS